MYRFNNNQLQFLANFFNGIAVAWFTSGIIGFYFADTPVVYKTLNAVFGIGLCGVTLLFGLKILKERE